MAGHTRLALTLLTLFYFISLVLAATPTEFCKCICFSNYTIIPLDEVPAPDPPKPTETESSTTKRNLLRSLVGLRSPAAGYATCNDCSKQFCLDQGLDICKDATEADVFTTCFQRDSAKDEAVVFIFIFSTVGLLIYAVLRPWVDQWISNIKERRAYIPLADGGR